MAKDQEAEVGQEAKLRSQRWGHFFFTLPFAIFFLINLYHHQMWRDEMNVWGIARASPTIFQLAHNIHYEGHPGLWYYLVWVPSVFTSHPSAMKWVEAVIGLSIYFIIGLFSPWTRFEKVLVFLSYYIVFEYTVLSRTYGLCLLLALCYICVRVKRPKAVIAMSILLGLLANTDILGVMLSGTLLVEYVWYLLVPAKGAAERPWRKISALISIYCGFVLASYLSLRPAKDISWVTTGHIGESIKDGQRLLFAILSSLSLPWFPLSVRYPHKFWNPSVEFHPLFFEIGSLFIVAALYILFRKNPRLLAFMALTIVASILFAHLIYMGYIRHFGVVFLAFLLAYWIKRSQEEVVARTAVVLLLLATCGGVGAVAASWTHPFSNSEAAAKWLVAHHLADKPIVGFPDFSTAAIAEHLNRPIYFSQCDCSDTYMQFSRRRDDVADEHLTEHLRRVDSNLNTTDYTLIVTDPLWPEEERDLKQDHQSVTLIASFTGAEEHYENFYLYDVRRVP